MKFLVDTHLLIWSALQPERLSRDAKTALADLSNDLCFSSVSIWEIAIKKRIGHPRFRMDVTLFRDELLVDGYTECGVNSAHAIATGSLPMLHKDPFDRLLIAQAAVEGMTLLTADATVAAYAGSIMLV